MPSPGRRGDAEMGEIRTSDSRVGRSHSKSHSRSTSRYHPSSHYDRHSRSRSNYGKPRSRSRSRSRHDGRRPRSRSRDRRRSRSKERRGNRSPGRDDRKRDEKRKEEGREGRRDKSRDGDSSKSTSSSSKRKLRDIDPSAQNGDGEAEAIGQEGKPKECPDVENNGTSSAQQAAVEEEEIDDAMEEEEPKLSKEEEEMRILEERKRRRMEIMAKYKQETTCTIPQDSSSTSTSMEKEPAENSPAKVNDSQEESESTEGSNTLMEVTIEERAQKEVERETERPPAVLSLVPSSSALPPRPPIDVAALQANISQALQRVKTVVKELQIDSSGSRAKLLEMVTDGAKEGDKETRQEAETTMFSRSASALERREDEEEESELTGDVLVPDAEVSFDMFDTEAFHASSAATEGTNLPTAGLSEGDDPNLKENWDDAEGYYNARIGEKLFDGKYQVLGVIGKGVFSTVVKCVDAQTGQGMVAVKLIRNNDTMRKAAQKELSILQELGKRDPEDKRHCVRLLTFFEHRSHTALAFEAMRMNLREVLKKFGKNVGVSLSAVRIYARQLFIALYHLQTCKVVHADIKPDNILVNDRYNLLKLCDFGSAFRINDPDNDPTPYLVSRYYRAPEIILGLSYDYAIDMWSVGCCLYEIFTGKVLFPGASNNDMLRLMMDIKGKPSTKMLKRHRVAYDRLMIEPHFDDDNKFRHHDLDRVTGKVIIRVVEPLPSKDLGSLLLASRASKDDRGMVLQLKDLLEKCFSLDPAKRLTVKEALQHPFVKK